MKLSLFNLKIQKKYLGFFTVIPLLLLTAVIKVPCPVCDGTGVVSSTGMSNVSVLQVDGSLVSVTSSDACLTYRTYTYNITLTMQNTAKTQDAIGWLNVGLVDTSTGKVMDTRSVVAHVPANQQVQNFFTVTFYLKSDIPANTKVAASIDAGDKPCPDCGGTGKVTLNNYLLDKFQKKASNEVQQIAAETYEPPETVLWPEAEIGQEWVTDQWVLEHPNGTDTPTDTTDTSSPEITEP